MHYSIHKEIGDDSTIRIFANLFGGHDLFGADDETFASTGHFEGKTSDTFDLAVAIHIGALDMNDGHIQDEGRQQSYFDPRERVFNHFSGTILKHICAKHGASWQERHTHSGGFHAPGDGS